MLLVTMRKVRLQYQRAFLTDEKCPLLAAACPTNHQGYDPDI